MSNNIYKPNLNVVYLKCVVTIVIIFTVTQLSGIIAIHVYYVSLTALVVAFMVFIRPIVTNQKLSINGAQINIFQYGQQNTLFFCEHIDSIFTQENNSISYLFKKNDKNYRIFPGTYKKREELETTLEKLKHQCNKDIPHVQK